MAKLEHTLGGDFDSVINAISNEILNGDGSIHISAITAGGSQATFFKINAWGEEAFLDKPKELL